MAHHSKHSRKRPPAPGDKRLLRVESRDRRYDLEEAPAAAAIPASRAAVAQPPVAVIERRRPWGLVSLAVGALALGYGAARWLTSRRRG